MKDNIKTMLTANDDRINNFLDAIENAFSGMDIRTFWPLNAGQIDSYFDAVEALDMYARILALSKTKSTKEIALMLPHPDIIRIFLEHNSIIGLKVANRLGIADMSAIDREKYLGLIFDILQQKVQNDIFCLDGKNIIWTQKEVDEVLDRSGWLLPFDDTGKDIAYLGVAASNLCYTLYFDVFMAAGFYLHGPYDVSGKYGPGHTMIVRQYHKLSPKELWPDAVLRVGEMTICSIYKNLDWKVNFANHPLTVQSMPDRLVASTIVVDDKHITTDAISGLIEDIEDTARLQAAKVNNMKPLEQVRKGAEISYYLFKDFREAMGDDWRPPSQVDENIAEFGMKFIEQFKATQMPNSKHWRKLFDPRNDYY